MSHSMFGGGQALYTFKVNLSGKRENEPPDLQLGGGGGVTIMILCPRASL